MLKKVMHTQVNPKKRPAKNQKIKTFIVLYLVFFEKGTT